MIELNADESMFFLITKSWTHISVSKQKDELRMQYIQRVCNLHVFGAAASPQKADIGMFYLPLAEKLLEKRQLIQAIESLVFLGPHLTPILPVESLISQLWPLPVFASDGKQLIKIDFSLVDTEGRAHLIYSKAECEAIDMWRDGSRPGLASDICGAAKYGYGTLMGNGYWEFPLPDEYIGAKNEKSAIV